jgi:hypothetical protein
MFFARLKPYYIARPDFFNRPAPTLRPTKAGRDDQRLAEWMCMPGGAGTRFERDACTPNACRFGCLEQRVNANCAGKIFGWPFAGSLRTRSFYLHVSGFLLLSTINSQPSTLLRSTSFNFHVSSLDRSVPDKCASRSAISVHA